MLKPYVYLPLFVGGVFLSSGALHASSSGEELIDTGKYYSTEHKKEFSYATAKFIDGGKTLSINAYDNPWFLQDGPEKDKIIKPIRDALSRKELTRVILDERYTGPKTYEDFSKLIAVNHSIKVLELPTYMGHETRMNNVIKPNYLKIFTQNHGLKIIAGENDATIDAVQITFTVP